MPKTQTLAAPCSCRADPVAMLAVASVTATELAAVVAVANEAGGAIAPRSASMKRRSRASTALDTSRSAVPMPIAIGETRHSLRCSMQ
ncbi:hypothetical protein WSK_0767 [Novosphingobium sp. Rr 2-17]|nr:hypothetical protein WSK_0767 [Novosphingobium sp. Rr 2-17]